MIGFHKSVLKGEIFGILEIKKGEWYLDATLGDGGYALEVLQRGGRVFGLDVDKEALGRSTRRFEDAGIAQDRFHLSLGNFRDLSQIVDSFDSQIMFEGAIFDLGVSSYQLETPERGFSFQKAGPLDMRMGQDLTVKALDLVNGLNKGELNELFKNYGQENYSRLIAEAVVRARPLTTTDQLAAVIEKTVRKRGRIHPATKVFQALRIAINDELEALSEALPKALGKLRRDGYLFVISFHSLEDRVVKDLFREWERDGLGKVEAKKPIETSEEEKLINPRSRSAKLRIFKNEQL